MKTAVKSLVCSSFGFVLTMCFAVTALARPPPPPPPTNRLDIGGNYQIKPPPSNMMFQVTDNAANAGDDNIVWSHSGRMLATDRSDPGAFGPGGNKYICLLDVRNLGNVQTIGARSSAATNPLFCNITGWTWNDDRVLFGWQPQVGNPPTSGKVRLMSCTATGAVSVVPFLQSDPQYPGTPTNHVYSPSVVFDQTANKERLLFLVSSSTNNDQNGPTDVNIQPTARINLYTVPFASGGVPNWDARVQLTDFNTNLSISSVRWCPELGTNYQPICNRLVILFTAPDRLVVLNNVQGIIANPTTAPTNLLTDSRFVVVETILTMNSQVSWTFDGQYVMYGRMGTNPPGSSDLYSMRADSSTNTAVKFEVPSSISGGNKQWLCISPDGMKAAFTVNKQVYVIPLQFDNIAVTGAVVTNVLTDASYTAVDVSGDAIPSNTTFSIVAPPSVDTNNFNGEFSGYARQFSVSGVSSQFDLLTNASMTLHFSEADIPSGVSATNLAIYVYNPEGSGGQTGTWDKLDSVIDTNKQTISAEVQHFSIYAIGRASAQPESAFVAVNDYDGNGKSDLAFFHDGNWFIYLMGIGGVISGPFGEPGWTTVSGDYDADGKSDLALFHDGNWLIYLMGSGNVISGPFGDADGIPVPGDYDADGKSDLALFHDGNWLIYLMGSGNVISGPFGEPGWTPVPGDYDADGKSDLALFHEGNWTIYLMGSGNVISGPFGEPGWTPVPGDYDGDGKFDLALFHDGDWTIYLMESGNVISGPFGEPGWIPVPGDYDGDGKSDLAFFHEGNWFIYLMGSGNVITGPFGEPDWTPVR